MAGISTRSVARLINTISTTPPLRRSAAPARTIASFKGLQNLAEPGRIPSESVEEVSFMSKHLEALSFWHQEAELMKESRILPLDENTTQVNFSEQVVELLEELVDSGIVDVRTGWLAEMHS